MTLRSQNGWSVLDHGELTWFTAVGVRFAAANADVATIGKYLIERFHTEVEPITGGIHDDWSFAVRNVRGSTTSISNHSSATAWDLNATQHPRGAWGTFTKAELRAIDNILDDITDLSGDRVIRWGGAFKTVVDAMHFELNAGARSVHQAAEKIRATQQAQEDKVTPADHKAIAAEVFRLMNSSAIVLNQKLHAADKPAANFTIPAVLSNIELNQDQEINRTGADRALDAVTRMQVSEIHAAVVTRPDAAKPPVT